MSERNGDGFPAYIHDGCTLDGYIAEQPGLYPAVDFKYRPAIRQERTVFYERIRKAPSGAAGDKEVAQAMKHQLVSWDIKDHNHKSLAITAPIILRLQPALFERIWEIIVGNQGSDARPDGPTDNEEESMEVELNAALEDSTPEDYTAKN